MKKHDSCYFCGDNDSYVHVGLYIGYWWNYRSLLHLLVGAKVPGCESSKERKFHTWNFPGVMYTRPIHIGGTTAPCYICWWERKFQGAKVPHLELSLPGANGLGSEKSIIRFVTMHNLVTVCKVPKILGTGA